MNCFLEQENSVIERIKHIFLKLFEIDIKEIDEFANIQDCYQLDSIDMVTLQIAIEDEFNVRFDPTEDNMIEIFTSISTIENYISLTI